MKKNHIYMLIVTCLLSLNFFVSIILEHNDVNIAINFFLVLIFMVLALTVKINRRMLKVFVILVSIFVVFLYFLEFYYMFNGDLWITDRILWKIKGIGDVYTYNNLFFRVQIRGNSLIPIAYFITYNFSDLRHQKKILVFLFGGIVIAGNMMYLLSILFFLVLNIVYFNIDKVKRFKLLLIVLLPTSIAIGFSYFMKLIKMKTESSLPIRLDQINVLINDMSNSKIFFLFGKGLGSTLEHPITPFRDYTGATYFELQSLYIFNQLGLLMFCMFIIIVIYLIKENMFKKK
ncbi:MAG: hypothetical protein KC455_05365, partial [Carnobacterium sp.]|nr:hypothetical protein [Carnobacterium sp.]